MKSSARLGSYPELNSEPSPWSVPTILSGKWLQDSIDDLGVQPSLTGKGCVGKRGGKHREQVRAGVRGRENSSYRSWRAKEGVYVMDKSGNGTLPPAARNIACTVEEKIIGFADGGGITDRPCDKENTQCPVCWMGVIQGKHGFAQHYSRVNVEVPQGWENCLRDLRDSRIPVVICESWLWWGWGRGGWWKALGVLGLAADVSLGSACLPWVPGAGGWGWQKAGVTKPQLHAAITRPCRDQRLAGTAVPLSSYLARLALRNFWVEKGLGVREGPTVLGCRCVAVELWGTPGQSRGARGSGPAPPWFVPCLPSHAWTVILLSAISVTGGPLGAGNGWPSFCCISRRSAVAWHYVLVLTSFTSLHLITQAFYHFMSWPKEEEGWV